MNPTTTTTTQFKLDLKSNMFQLYTLLEHYLLRHQMEEASQIGLTMLHAFYKVPAFLMQPLWGMAKLKAKPNTVSSFFDGVWRFAFNKTSKLDIIQSELEGVLVPYLEYLLENSQFDEVVEYSAPHRHIPNPFLQGYLGIANYYKWKALLPKGGIAITEATHLREDALNQLGSCINLFLKEDIIVRPNLIKETKRKKNPTAKKKSSKHLPQKVTNNDNEFEDDKNENQNNNNNNNNNNNENNNNNNDNNNDDDEHVVDYSYISVTHFVKLYCKITMHVGKEPEVVECMDILKKFADIQERNPSAQQLAAIFYLKHANTKEQTRKTTVFFDRLMKLDPTSRLALFALAHFCEKGKYDWFELLKGLVEHIDYCFQSDTIHQFDKDEIEETWQLFEEAIENSQTNQEFGPFWKKKLLWLDFYAFDLPPSTKTIFKNLDITSDDDDNDATD